ncbi:MAG: aspartyl protease family protein [Saprospirales bacterium]|nr:aspartyl protease family protein [Saprospirales bacterium]
MKGWMTMLGSLLVVLEAIAQPPIALVDVDFTTQENRNFVFQESSVGFDVRSGLILVKATLDGIPGTYVLDTGAPGLVINQLPQGESELEGRGVTGSMAVEETEVGQFRLGNVQFYQLKAYKIDLSYLEKRLLCEIDGLIGYEVLRKMEIVLDYPNQTITFLPEFASSMDVRGDAFFPFHLVNHIPVVEAQLGKRTISLGVDTGAGANVLNKHLGKPYQTKNSKQKQVRGVDRKIRKTTVVQAPVDINGLGPEKQGQEYWLLDLSQLRSDLDHSIDGLLGFPFLKGGKWSIDYGAQRIYKWSQ